MKTYHTDFIKKKIFNQLNYYFFVESRANLLIVQQFDDEWSTVKNFLLYSPVGVT